MKLSTIGFIVLVVFVAGCTTTSTNIRFLKNTELKIPHLPGKGRVEGRDCSYRFLFFSWSRPRVDLAIMDSIANRNHQYNALADAEIIYSRKPYWHRVIGSKECIIVVGRPVLLDRPKPPAGMIPVKN